MHRVLLPSIAVFAALLSGQTASAQVTLTYQFPDGGKAVTAARVTTHQILTIAGMPLETKATQVVQVESTNGARDADGNLTVKEKITRVKTELSTPAGDLEYDSNEPDAPPPGTQIDFILDAFKAMVNSEFTTVYDKNNHVTAVKGRDSILDKVDDTVKALMQSQLEEDHLVETANQEMAKIPSTPVSPGDTWDRTEVAHLEAGQKLTFKTTYKYEGVVDKAGRKLHKISATTSDVSLTQDDTVESPVKIKDSDLNVAESESSYHFDDQMGQFVISESSIQIKGTVTLEAGGNELPGELDLTLKQLATRK